MIINSFHCSNDLICSTVSTEELKTVVASSDDLKKDSFLSLMLNEADIFHQEKTLGDGLHDIKNVKTLLSQYKNMIKSDGASTDLSFRFNIEMALVCYRSENYSVSYY